MKAGGPMIAPDALPQRGKSEFVTVPRGEEQALRDTWATQDMGILSREVVTEDGKSDHIFADEFRRAYRDRHGRGAPSDYHVYNWIPTVEELVEVDIFVPPNVEEEFVAWLGYTNTEKSGTLVETAIDVLGIEWPGPASSFQWPGPASSGQGRLPASSGQGQLPAWGHGQLPAAWGMRGD